MVAQSNMVVEDIFKKRQHDGMNEMLYKFVTDNKTEMKQISLMDDSSQAFTTNKGNNKLVFKG